MNENIKCPKCSLEQPSDTYCANCGVHMEKYGNHFIQKIKSRSAYVLVFGVVILSALIFLIFSPHKNSSSRFDKEVNESWKTLKSRPLVVKKQTSKTDSISDSAISRETQEVSSLAGKKAVVKPKKAKPNLVTSSSFSAQIKLFEVPVAILKDILSETPTRKVFSISSRALERLGNPYHDETKDLRLDVTYDIYNETLFLTLERLVSEPFVANLTVEIDTRDSEIREEVNLNLSSKEFLLVPTYPTSSPLPEDAQPETEEKWAVLVISEEGA